MTSLSDHPETQRLWNEAVVQFNAQEFFACHDLLEEIWSEADEREREFYQGLIHAAVSLFHFGEANWSGARKMYHTTLKYLEPYLALSDLPQPLALQQFYDDYRICFAELAAAKKGEYPTEIRLNPGLIPRWRMAQNLMPKP